MKSCKCYKCFYKGRSPCKGLIYCAKRKQLLEYIQIVAWGCDDFKEKYTSLLKEEDFK